MSKILDNLKSGGFVTPSNFSASVKLELKHMAMIEAVSKLRGGSKSDAIRFLIELGWEAIEEDEDFVETVSLKEIVEDSYYLEESEFGN